jgi:hypothetical protein
MDCVVAPPGAQEYVPPVVDGVAVNVALVPAQTEVELTVTVGIGLIIIDWDATSVHPVADVVTKEMRYVPGVEYV